MSDLVSSDDILDAYGVDGETWRKALHLSEGAKPNPYTTRPEVRPIPVSDLPSRTAVCSEGPVRSLLPDGDPKDSRSNT